MASKRLISCIVILSVLSSMCVHFSDTPDQPEIMDPLTSGTPSDLNISKILFSNSLGSDVISWQIDGYLNGTTLSSGTYTIKLTDLLNLDSAYDISNASSLGEHNITFSQIQADTSACVNDIIPYSVSGASPYLLVNNSNALSYNISSDLDISVSALWSIYNDANAIDITLDSDFTLEYHLLMDLGIISRWDQAELSYQIYDYSTDTWISQSQISLSHPYYKLRVYHQEDLIFEDSENQLFTPVRELDLDTLLLTNNANYPVNFSGIENGHYQSNSEMSWDLTEVNTRPSNLNYSNEGLIYLENEYQDHNKEMLLDSSYSTQYGSDEIQFENLDNIETSGDVSFQSSITLDKTVSNIIQLTDSDTGTSFFEQQVISNQYFSFILGSNDSTYATYIRLFDSEDNLLFQFYQQSDKIYFQEPGPIYTYIGDITPNSFNHIVFSLNFGDNLCYVWKNGEYINSYTMDSFSTFDYFLFTTASSHSNYESYLSSVYCGDSFDDAMQSLHPQGSIEINHETTNYKVEGSLSNSEFTIVNGVGCEVNYIDYLGHSDVIQIYDGDNTQSSSISCEYDESPQTDEIFDFYWGYNGNDITWNEYFRIAFSESTAFTLAKIYLMFNYRSVGSIEYQDSIGYHTLTTVNENRLYHISIHCDDSENTFDLYLDGVLLGDNCNYYESSSVGINYFSAKTRGAGYDYYNYLDSLSIKSQGYEPFSNDIYNYYKTNCVQWGTASDSYDYKRYNSTGEIITGIEDWGTTDDDIFNSYDYKYDDYQMTSPKTGVVQWGTSDAPSIPDSLIQSCDTSEIVSEYEGHQNVNHIIEALGTNKKDQITFSSQTSGSIEFYADEIGDRGLIGLSNIAQGNTYYVLIRMYVSSLNIYYGSTYTNIARDGLTLIKIDFDCNTDKQTISIDGTEVLSNEDFLLNRTITTVDSLAFGGYDIDHATDLYFDAVGFSWDSYSSGDNQLINGWLDTSGTDCSVETVDFQGHENVLNISDSSLTDYASIYHSFDAQLTGTTELYWNVEQTLKSQYFGFYDAVGSKIMLTIGSLGLYYYKQSTTSYVKLMDIDANHWYHTQIEFTTTTFQITIDGTVLDDAGNEDLPLRWTSSGLNGFKIYTYGPESTQKFYVDALSFSWDGYTNGDNQQWFDFDDLSYGDTSCTIAQEVDGHQHVLNLTDNDSTIQPNLYYDLESSAGLWEFYFLTTDITKDSRFTIYDGDGTNGIYLGIEASTLQYYVDSSWNFLYTIQNNEWNHFSIEYDCSSTWAISVNGNLLESNIDFRGSPSTMDTMELRTWISDSNYQNYYDGIGFSSEKNYQAYENVPSPVIRNGSFEWWQNNAINSTSLYTGDISFHWNETEFYAWNGTDYETIESGNQITNIWNRYSLQWDLSHVYLYRDNLLIYNLTQFATNLDYFQFTALNNANLRIDAIDYSLENVNVDFTVGANANLNTSEDLWCWEAFPQWESNNSQGNYNWNYILENWYHDQTEEDDSSMEFVDFLSYNNIIEYHYSNDEASPYHTDYYRCYSSESLENNYEVSINLYQDTGYTYIAFYNETSIIGYVRVGASNIVLYTKLSGFGETFSHDKEWINIRLVLSSNRFSLYMNQIFTTYVEINSNDLYYFKIGSESVLNTHAYFSSIDTSSSVDYFPYRSILENTTTSPLSMNYNFSQQVNPYSQEIINITETDYFYNITDLYCNELDFGHTNATNLIYTPSSYEEVLLAYADTNGNTVNFEDFTTTINNITLTQPWGYFERNSNLVITTSWNQSVIQTTSYMVQPEYNLIVITLNLTYLSNFADHQIVIEISNTNYSINPYSQIILHNVSASVYTIYDRFGSELETGMFSNTIEYIPVSTELCIISYYDQDQNFIEFSNVITKLLIENNTMYLNSESFYTARNTSMTIESYDAENTLIESTNYIVENGVNNIEIELDVLYLENHADETVNMSFIVNGNYQGAESFNAGFGTANTDYGYNASIEDYLEYHANYLQLNATETINYKWEKSIDWTGDPLDGTGLFSKLNYPGAVLPEVQTIEDHLNCLYWNNTDFSASHMEYMQTTSEYVYNDLYLSFYLYISFPDVQTNVVGEHLNLFTVNGSESNALGDIGFQRNQIFSGVYEGVEFQFFDIETDINVANNSWQHIMCHIQDGSDQAEMYINGSYIDSYTMDSTFSVNYNHYFRPLSEIFNVYESAIDSLYIGSSFSEALYALHPLDSISFSNSPQATGSLEWYQRGEGYLNVQNTTLIFNNSQISYWFGESEYLINSNYDETIWNLYILSYSATQFTLYENGISLGTYSHAGMTCANISFLTWDVFLLDAVDWSWASGFISGRNTNFNTSIELFQETALFSTLISPYSSKTLFYYRYAYFVQISDLYSNELEFTFLDFDEKTYSYIPSTVETCFISLADQQANYLDWEQFRLYKNNTLLYENLFYAELGTSWNVSVCDRFGNYLTSLIHTVVRDTNYLTPTITLYSLKIFNQQEEFLHANITQPGTSNFWSEWLAPNEIGSYRLIPGSYVVSITAFEGGESTTDYNLDFASDDILLISSTNTISSVILSLLNQDVFLDEQFTYIQLNFTNVDSVIGNQTTMIEINFANTDSNFENLFVSSNYFWEFANDTLGDIYSLSLNSWEFGNLTLNNLYALSEDSWTFMNDTVGDLSIMSENFYNFANSSLASLEMISLNNFNYLNNCIDDSRVYMAQNFTFTQNLLNQSKLDILTQCAIISSNITNNSIDIMNNLLAVNSTMSNLTAELSNYVFLVNDTIYTAVLNTTNQISLQNNLILANLSISFQQNEFLTDILKHTLFSELLNWENVGFDYSLMDEQIETVNVLNNLRNETIKVLFKYQNEVEEQILGAMNNLDLDLPASGVDYRIYSMENRTYLTDWEDVPSNLTISWGEYTEILPATPEQIHLEIKDYLQIALFATISLIAIAAFYIRSKQKLAKEVPQRRSKVGVRNELGAMRARERVVQKNGALAGALVICVVIIMSFLGVFLLT